MMNERELMDKIAAALNEKSPETYDPGMARRYQGQLAAIPFRKIRARANIAPHWLGWTEQQKADENAKLHRAYYTP